MSIDDKVVLKDGKNNWKDKKMSNIKVLDCFKRLVRKYGYVDDKLYNIAERLEYCGKFLMFKENSETKEKKLHKAYFCQVRLCPICAWRRTKKIYGQVAKIVQEIDKAYNYEYLFLTLTVENCVAEELDKMMKQLLNSFHRMITNNKQVKAICKGYFRALEVTYNQKENTYHPHIHTIIAVNKSYFTDRTYIRSSKWSEIWQHYLKVDYTPIIDIRKIDDRHNKKHEHQYVSEVAKYTVKEKDIFVIDETGKVNEEYTDENLYILHKALKRKRLVGMGGIFKELHKKLNLEDTNKDKIDLVNTDNEVENSELAKTIIERYQWSVGYSNYILLKED